MTTTLTTMDMTSETNNAKIPVPFPSTSSPSSYPSSSQTPRRRPSLASPSPPTPLFPSTSSSTPLKSQRAPPAPLVLPTSTSSPQHHESGGSSSGTPYHYSSKSRPSTAGSRTSGRSQSVSMPLLSNSQPLGVGVSLSGTGTMAVPPDSPGARAMMKRLLANPSPAGGSPSDRGGYASPVERERERGYASPVQGGYGSPYGATSGSESEGFGLYASAAGWTRRGGAMSSPSTEAWRYGSGSESGHGPGYSSYGSRGRHKVWRSTSGEDTNGETELPYYTRSGSASGSQSESPYPKILGPSLRQTNMRAIKPTSTPAEVVLPEDAVKEKEKRQRNVLRRRTSGRITDATESTPPQTSAANGLENRAPSLPIPIPVSPIRLSVPIPTIGSISAPQSPTYPNSPLISPLPSPSLSKSSKNLQRSASASALKANNIPRSPRHRSSVAGLSKSPSVTGQTISHGATLRPPLPYGQNQQLHPMGVHAGESVLSFHSAKSQSSRGSSSAARSPVVSTLLPVSRTGSGSASGHGSARGSAGGGKSPIRERHERDLKESMREKAPERTHMTPAEALVAAYKKQEQEAAQRSREAEMKKEAEAKKAQKDSMKASRWTPPQDKGPEVGSYEDHSSSSSHQDHYMTPASKQKLASTSNGDSSPTPYYTVFGSTSGRVVAVGSPEDSTWDTTYKHGYWDSSVLGSRSVTVSTGEKSESKTKGLRTLTRKVSERWKKQSVAGATAVVGRIDDDLASGSMSGGGVRMSVDSARAQVQLQSKSSKTLLGGAGRASMQEKRPSGLNTPFSPKSFSGAIPRSPRPRTANMEESSSSMPNTLRRKRSTLAPHQEHQQEINRRSLRLSIDKFPDIGDPHLPLLPARGNQQPHKSPHKDTAQAGYPAPRSFSQPMMQPQPQQRPCSRTAPSTPTIPTPGSASPSTSSISVSMSQRQSKAPSTPSVTSINGAAAPPVMSPTTTSGSSSGGKFWKLMRRLSVGGLKEKYHEAGGEDTPPVPPLPATFAPSASPIAIASREERGRSEVDSDSPKIPSSQPQRSKSLEAESMIRSRNSPSEKPPVPNLPRSSMSSAPPRASTTKRPSTGVPSSSSTTPSRPSTVGRPSTATRSSSPLSSDVGSSKRFFYKAQSGASSSSSFIDDGTSKPPLPAPVGASPLAQHIIPPPELDKVHDREDQWYRSRDKLRERRDLDRKSSERDRQDEHRQRQDYQHTPLPVPPRSRQTFSEVKDMDSGPPSPDIPAFSTNDVINTFKPRTTPTTSPIKTSPTVSLAQNLPTLDRKAPPTLTLNASLPPPPRPTRSAARPGPRPIEGPSLSAVGGFNGMQPAHSSHQEGFISSPQHSANTGLRRGASASAAVPSMTKQDPSQASKPLPRIEQETIPVGRKSESHVWDHGGYAYDTFGHSRLNTPTAANFGPDTFNKVHHRRSSGGLSTASTARPDGMLRVKRRTNSFGASSLSTTSLISNATVEPSDAEDDVAVLQFRELNNDPGPKKVLTEKEKADKWADLLERSAKAGGTLHFAGESRGW